ncbi:MAG TPA: DUF2461 domain-containing protein [Vicinamibacterales bacterium]|nr:DUF2461 domain-containing protein [Vicinamibacterales bacterium]
MADAFAGFPRAATEFFRELARNNNRDWFQAHKDVYEQSCREPLKALVAELDPVGTPQISRINRDMRFSRDGAPYKTHIAAGVLGTYINLSAEGLYVGTGMYRPEPAVLQKFRSAIDADQSGRELAKVVSTIRRKGYMVGTHESVNSAPRGYAADHPRIELLRMKDIHAGKTIEPGPVLASRKAVAAVKKVMDDVRPLAAWIGRYV